MTPLQLSKQLRHIASDIDNSDQPQKHEIASSLKSIIRRIASSQFVCIDDIDDSFKLINASTYDEARKIVVQHLIDNGMDENTAVGYVGKYCNVFPYNGMQEISAEPYAGAVPE